MPAPNKRENKPRIKPLNRKLSITQSIKFKPVNGLPTSIISYNWWAYPLLVMFLIKMPNKAVPPTQSKKRKRFVWGMGATKFGNAPVLVVEAISKY